MSVHLNQMQFFAVFLAAVIASSSAKVNPKSAARQVENDYGDGQGMFSMSASFLCIYIYRLTKISLK